ncbi:hypothetical protein Q4E40_02890 [Pontibacter sp. BT731]|uniref:hypothetical protein n=1 Tax=Pontibacter coccineus TaxID=3063328 RepID=UPI0026E16159|nr:hypothetical protein [Pontibacter sp. BT731]MDO6389060.1 hypothetical protein [Pontibacter sp. BT731]
MTNPYNGRFLEAFAYLKSRGVVKSQNKFCSALGFPPTHMTGIKSGKRNISLQTITNLYTVYGVSLYYMVLGRGPVMAPSLDEEEKHRMELELERTRQALTIYERLLEAKDEEIRYLRELLRLEVNKEGDKGS